MTARLNTRLIFLAIWSVAVAVFILAPLVVVIAVSLTPENFISLPLNGISFRWYLQLAEHEDFGYAAINSLLLAFISSFTSVALGTLAAVATVRYRFAAREVLRLAVTSPLFVPMVLSGLAILIFASAHGIHSQATRLYVAHTALTLPYVFRTVSSSLTGFDPNQELAAKNLGASPFRAFMLVTLPQIMPGIMAGVVFAFIISFDNVSLSIFLAGIDFPTLPVQLFSYAMNDSDPMAAAVSVLMILASIGAILCIERIFGLQRLM